MGPQCVVWGLGGEDKKTETGPDHIIFQGQKAGTVCSRFFIFLLMNRLAVCLGLHTAPWYSGYCTASKQTNSTFWARALSVSMLHNQDGLSINRSSSNKYQPPPMDKHCLSRHTHSVSIHVHTLLCCTYTHFVSPHVPTYHTISCTFILIHILEKKQNTGGFNPTNTGFLRLTNISAIS